jgi:putative copper resistance protein D
MRRAPEPVTSRTTERAAARAAAALAAMAVVGVAVAVAVGLAVAPRPASLADATLPAARLLLDGCAVTAVGISVLRWLATNANRRDAESVRAAAARAAVVVAGAWAALALIVLWLQAAEVSGQPAGSVGMRALGYYTGGFGAGAGLLVTVAAATAFGVAARCGAPEGLLAATAVLGLLPPPLSGHASSAGWHELAVVSVAVHAVAAAAWIGGLGALMAAAGARRALLATALSRFSHLAGWCVAALAASGVLNAVIRLGSAHDLIGTGYGRILIAKTALLLILAALGAHIRRRILPAVAAHRPSPLRTFAAIELTLMTAALALASALTRAAP